MPLSVHRSAYFWEMAPSGARRWCAVASRPAACYILGMDLRPYRTIKRILEVLEEEEKSRSYWEALAKTARRQAAIFEDLLNVDPAQPGAELLRLREENQKLASLVVFTDGFTAELKRWIAEQRGTLDYLDRLATDPRRPT